MTNAPRPILVVGLHPGTNLEPSELKARLLDVLGDAVSNVFVINGATALAVLPGAQIGDPLAISAEKSP